MAFNNGYKIVTDGLVLNLDAADRNSYVSGSTTWRDLSGNNYNGTLVNSPTFSSVGGGSIVFNGTNNYVTTSYIQPAQDNTTTSFTWDLWVYPVSSSNNVIIGYRGGILDFNKLTPLTWEYYPDNLGVSMPLNVWQNIHLIKNGSSIYYYRNASLINSRAITVTKPTYPFYVGGDPGLSEYGASTIASVRVYNRALSISEIQQNFNVMRYKFNI